MTLPSSPSLPSSSLLLRVVAGLLLSNLLSLLLGAGIGICIYRRSVLYCICLLSRCWYGFCIYQRFVFHCICICICVHVQDILYVVFIADPDFFNIVFLTLHFHHIYLKCLFPCQGQNERPGPVMVVQQLDLHQYINVVKFNTVTQIYYAHN